MSETSAEEAVQEACYSFPYHYLDLRLPEYELILHVEYRHYLGLVRERLAPFTGQHVLDAGCGDGRFCYEMREVDVRMTGVDMSERALAFARAFNPGVTFLHGDLRDLRLETPPDSAVMIETLEHIPPSDVPGVVAGLAALLRPGSRLVVTVPSVLRPLPPKHFRHFTERTLAEALEPHFRMLECVGYARRGLHWELFARFRGVLRRSLGGWLDRSGAVHRLFASLAAYQTRHFGTGSPGECAGLVAVFERSAK